MGTEGGPVDTGEAIATAMRLVAAGLNQLAEAIEGHPVVVSAVEPVGSSSTEPPMAIPFVEAARMLGVRSEAHAYEMHRQGNFPVPVLRVGRRLMVSRKKLLEFIDG